MHRSDVVLGAPTVGDGAAMWQVARTVGLDENSPYKYLLFCRDFAATSVVARSGTEVVGFVTGYRRPAEPEALFVWQIGVLPARRGEGLAAAMLDEVAGRSVASGPVRPRAAYLEATVTPDNDASLRLFSAFADRHGAGLVGSVLFASELFPDAHGEELLLRIGPL